jgi:hypothetical protein
MKFSKTPDMVVATSYWLYLTLRRLGREREARRVLEPIRADMEIIENADYHRLLLAFKARAGVDLLQGYYFAAPLFPEKCVALLASDARLPAAA